MGIVDTVTREGGDKLILWAFLVFFGSVIILRVGIPIARWLLGLFGIVVPMVNLGAIWLWVMIFLAVLLLFKVIVGRGFTENPWTTLIVSTIAVLFIIGLGIYLPKAYDPAFTAALLDLKVTLNSFIALP